MSSILTRGLLLRKTLPCTAYFTPWPLRQLQARQFHCSSLQASLKPYEKPLEEWEKEDEGLSKKQLKKLMKKEKKFQKNVNINKYKSLAERQEKKMEALHKVDIKETVVVTPNMKVKDLATATRMSTRQIKDHLMNLENVPDEWVLGQLADITAIPLKMTEKLVENLGCILKVVEKTEENEDIAPRPPADPSTLKPRPPVVTIMGHVDHGKTTLLDALRKSNVVDQEFGGITQHIGAFNVKLPTGKDTITFLDTPGHAAFSAMRARGAEVTDIIVLVIAADDGVMSQTVESITHAKDAGVPIIVAINKIDKFNADIDCTKSQLQELGIEIEDFGGSIQTICISALKGTNLLGLEEAIIAQAELMGLSADPTGMAEGTILESRMDKILGPVSTVVVQRGDLKIGSHIVAGTAKGKVQKLLTDTGREVESVLPGMPVEIVGWDAVPPPGELVLEVESVQKARSVIDYRANLKTYEHARRCGFIAGKKYLEHAKEHKERLVNRFMMGRHRYGHKQFGYVKQEEKARPSCDVILKVDVKGSLEAIFNVLDTYQSDLCDLNVVHYDIGEVNQTDIELAETFDGIIMAFNVKLPPTMRRIAQKKQVAVKEHKVIYHLLNDLKKEIEKRIPIKTEEKVIGEAEVIQTYQVKNGNAHYSAAGCFCTEGQLHRKEKVKVLRPTEGTETVLFDGTFSGLKHFKTEVDVIKTNSECGLTLSGFSDRLKSGDKIICYKKQVLKCELDWTF